MTRYDKISEEPKPKKTRAKKPSEKKTVAKEPAKKAHDAKEIENYAFKFIAGELGSDTGQARKKLQELGFDADEVISTALKILKGEYFQ